MTTNAYGITSVHDLTIEPLAERYYEHDADFWMAVAYEWCHDWQYDGDEHSYCHQRSVVMGLLAEIERLRKELGGGRL